jgi:hypothetical protein
MHHSIVNRAGRGPEDPSMNTPLRIGIACLALLMTALQARAQAAAEGFDLITATEAREEAQAQASTPPAPMAPRTRSLPVPKPNQPVIQVVAPNAPGEAIPAPVRIQLAFKPAPGARIVPSTFRVLYGLLKIDLTERLRKHATVTEEGVVVDRAQIPAGQHRLILQVADDQGNTAEQELRLRVGGAS